MWSRFGIYVRRHHLALLCLFLILGGGTAWALGRDSVKSKHIAPDAAKGVDVDEATLGTVPNADQIDGMDSADFIPASRMVSTQLVKVDYPATETTNESLIASAPPFEFHGVCSHLPDDLREAAVRVTSTQAGDHYGVVEGNDGRFETWDGSSDFIPTSLVTSGTSADEGIMNSFMVTPTSGQMFHGNAFAGVNLNGTDDCFFSIRGFR